LKRIVSSLVLHQSLLLAACTGLHSKYYVAHIQLRAG
jgi:hypothetical protein